MTVVLDASALLAYLQRETGADTVRAALGEAVISTVNWAEVVQEGRDGRRRDRSAQRGHPIPLGLVIQPFSTIQV